MSQESRNNSLRKTCMNTRKDNTSNQAKKKNADKKLKIFYFA